jgi:hypothetical protein
LSSAFPFFPVFLPFLVRPSKAYIQQRYLQCSRNGVAQHLANPPSAAPSTPARTNSHPATPPPTPSPSSCSCTTSTSIPATDPAIPAAATTTAFSRPRAAHSASANPQRSADVARYVVAGDGDSVWRWCASWTLAFAGSWAAADVGSVEGG